MTLSESVVEAYFAVETFEAFFVDLGWRAEEGRWHGNGSYHKILSGASGHMEVFLADSKEPFVLPGESECHPC